MKKSLKSQERDFAEIPHFHEDSGNSRINSLLSMTYMQNSHSQGVASLLPLRGVAKLGEGHPQGGKHGASAAVIDRVGTKGVHYLLEDLMNGLKVVKWR
jgi:hypothetical protein